MRQPRTGLPKLARSYHTGKGLDDPVKESDLIEKRLDCGWVLAAVAQRLGALQQSAARYPTSSREELSGYPSTVREATPAA